MCRPWSGLDRQPPLVAISGSNPRTPDDCERTADVTDHRRITQPELEWRDADARIETYPNSESTCAARCSTAKMLLSLKVPRDRWLPGELAFGAGYRAT
jgi:hypothetical protein